MTPTNMPQGTEFHIQFALRTGTHPNVIDGQNVLATAMKLPSGEISLQLSNALTPEQTRVIQLAKTLQTDIPEIARGEEDAVFVAERIIANGGDGTESIATLYQKYKTQAAPTEPAAAVKILIY